MRYLIVLLLLGANLLYSNLSTSTGIINFRLIGKYRLKPSNSKLSLKEEIFAF